MPRPIGYRAKKPTLASELTAREAAATAATQAIDATDSARKFAAEHNINLADVAGSGVDGRITKADVESHLAALAAAESETDAGGKQL